MYEFIENEQTKWYPGDLICLEGPDGVGKTTQAQLLYESLSKSPAVIEKYPGGVHIASASEIDPVVTEIRKLLFGGLMTEMSDNANVALYLAYHLQIVDKYVRPWVQEGGLVIMDRTAFSNQIYNLARPNLDPDMQDFYLEMLGPIPSLLIYLQPCANDLQDFFTRCEARAKQRGKVWHKDIASYADQCQRYESMFETLFESGRYPMSGATLHIEASASVKEIHEECLMPLVFQVYELGEEEASDGST